MRVTGVAVAVIGFAITTYCAIMYMIYNVGEQTDPGLAAYHKRIATNFLIPLAISGGTIALGLGLAIFGDKGFKFSRSLSERN